MCFEVIRIREVAKYIGREDILIVDLRDKADYLKGHIPGARNLPYDETEDPSEWNNQLKHMVKMCEERTKISIKQVLVYCGRGNISLLVVRNLYKEGYPISNLYGGFIAYRGPIERKYID